MELHFSVVLLFSSTIQCNPCTFPRRGSGGRKKAARWNSLSIHFHCQVQVFFGGGGGM